MPITHPFAWLPSPWLLPLCVILAVAAIAFGNYLSRIGAPIDKALAGGMMAVEAPWSEQRAEAVRRALDGPLIDVARKQTTLDFVFLVLYPLALSAACALLSTKVDDKAQLLGVLISWAVLLAAPLDAIENASVFQLLDGNTRSPWPQVSTICASIKFTLALGAFAYVAITLVSWIVQWLRGHL